MSITTDTFNYPDGTLGPPWQPWTSVAMPDVVGGVAFRLAGGLGDTSTGAVVAADCFFEAIFDGPMSDSGENMGVGARLTAHNSSADAYSFDVGMSGSSFIPRVYKGSAFTTLATGSAFTDAPDGVRIVVTGSTTTTIKGYARIGGAWTEVVSFDDSTSPITAAGYGGFWITHPPTGSLGVNEVSWGLASDLLPRPAAERFFARLEPIAYADTENGGVLKALATALMAPREMFEVARADADHDIPWGALLDPDATPAELLPWLAVLAGVIVPPSATTEAEQRSRITQAAGQYRGTNQAMTEEIQRSLTGTKSVRIIEHAGGDPWAVVVITKLAETPDAAAVARTAQAQKRAGLSLQYIATNGLLVDEATRTIDALSGTIDSGLLADWT